MKTIPLKLLLILLSLFWQYAFAQTKPGTLDPDFGTEGKIKLDFGHINQPYGHARALAVQPDGKIVVVGDYYYNRRDYVKAFYRFKEDGTNDSSFGNSGAAIFINDSLRRKILRPSSILIQPDGKILSGGNYYNKLYSAQGFILTRLLATGNIDEQFGKNGEVIFDEKSDNNPAGFSGLATQRNGKILVAYSFNENAVARYTKNGKTDSAFGVNGKLIIDSYLSNSITDIAIQPDDKVLILIVDRTNGANNWNFKIVRILPDGVFDSSFGDKGVRIIDFNNTQDGPSSFTILPDGGILIAGSVWGDTGFTGVVKLKSNGSIDSSFAVNGKAIYSMDGIFAPIKILAASDGKFFVTGNALGRFNYDGTKDSAFGYNGFTSDHQASQDAALQKDDKLLILVYSQFEARRYNGDQPIEVQLLKDIAMNEGDAGITTASFKLVLNRASAYDVKVNYSTLDGSAVSGSDYVGATGNAVIKSGKITKDILVNIIGDILPEKSEKFALVIINPINAALGSKDTAVCNIKNDDIGFAFSTEAVIADGNIKGIKIYPNPAKDILRIEGFNAFNKTSISVIDMNGNIVLKTTSANNNCTLNIQRLSAGVYELKMESGGKTKTMKFVKE